jgi:peptide-methionine (R)-S-oxide reductase
MATMAVAGIILLAAHHPTRDDPRAWREAPATTAARGAAKTEKKVKRMDKALDKVEKTEAEWRRALTPEQFRILRQKGTEPAFTGKYHAHHASGIYRCAGCGLELFDSKTKFDSGSGWPSFWAPATARNVAEHRDLSFGMVRTEVECARCGGHLGHVFDDGPAPTNQRYCINSAALNFAPR